MAEIIDSHMERAEETLSDFKNKSLPRIAISVDMLDTGIDVPAIQNLVFAKPGIQEGLMKLWELGLLDQSMEALVIQDRFQPLFTKAEIQEARRRLTELGYNPE